MLKKYCITVFLKCGYYKQDTKHSSIKCQYHYYGRDILVNKLNDIGVEFELDILLREKSHYYILKISLFPVYVNLLN